MTTLLGAPPAERDLDDDDTRGLSEAVDDRAVPSGPARVTLSAWACGMDPADLTEGEACGDFEPELIVELL
ncbi:MAG: hypothetical protein ABI622_03345 [Chloroflexota bacterium]